ncbi:MAG: DUF3369 domain-containing protein [Magnetococcales bacterium]|nr:DUF3369 domain-containing protein [Magnetococcales bacterium]
MDSTLFGNSDSDVPLFFAEEPSGTSARRTRGTWKIVVVDDDRGVHEITSMILRRFQFEERGIELISGYSGAEARSLMRQHPDTAVLLLDVVMEREDAGLDVVRYVREDLDNRKVRIILRTGQPGQAPEVDVISNYDINDYREKTELTQEKLLTAIITSLRSFRDLDSVERRRMGWARVAEATGGLFGPRSEKKLLLEVLKRLHEILGVDGMGGEGPCSGFAAREEEGVWRIHGGTGIYESMEGCDLSDGAANPVVMVIQAAIASGRGHFEGDRYAVPFPGYNQEKNILFFQANRDFTDLDGNLLHIFMSNVGMAFQNMHLHHEVIETQRDITATLGELIEARSSEFGSHVQRVAESSRLLGQGIGLPEEEIEALWLAAALHDLGKVVLEDRLLRKTGPLEPEELARIRRHATLGFEILKGSRRKLMRLGATVAHQHHERWDGRGYPQGLRGEEIHLYARIVALVDVFDAMIHDRVYRKGCSRDEAVSFIGKSRGTLFDPALVEVFLKNLPDFLDIQDRIPDKGVFHLSLDIMGRATAEGTWREVRTGVRPTDVLLSQLK